MVVMRFNDKNRQYGIRGNMKTRESKRNNHVATTRYYKHIIEIPMLISHQNSVAKHGA